MEPQVFSLIPFDKPFGMDQVIKKALISKKQVNSFLIKKGFIDIGDKVSYRKAYQQFLEKLGNI